VETVETVAEGVQGLQGSASCHKALVQAQFEPFKTLAFTIQFY
jgi:hypothetical protein